jgi:hypothetical protein
MSNVSNTTIIHAPTDAAWQVISDFGTACQYLVMVVNCTVEGAGVGALRRLTSADGSTVVERLDVQDEATHQLSYALLSDTPFGNCLTTMALHDLGPSRVELVWSASFDADGIPVCEAAEILMGALAADSLALKQFIEQRC